MEMDGYGERGVAGAVDRSVARGCPLWYPPPGSTTWRTSMPGASRKNLGRRWKRGPLTMTHDEGKKLMKAAEDAAARAYAPYSGFRVGCAVSTPGGAVYTGANVDNASYGLSICAERVALAAARTAGETAIDAIAVACIDRSPEGDLELGVPCGACRQWIQDLAPDAEIFVAGHEGSLRIGDLLPRAFRLPKGRT